jgi:1,2-phenylacetyl-CoA epoxidase catalytic subunit
VVTLTDTLRDALANADADQLTHAAIAWSATEEFRGRGDADLLGDFLNRFATLARTARSRDQSLYCWMSL